MNKLNKKGFTLIELMAVVIILIIIIFIAITRISKNVEDTENNTIIANAGAYIKAVNSFIQVESLNNPAYTNGAYTFKQLDELGVNVSGTKPSSGKFIIGNAEVISACLVYNGQYVVLENGEVSKPEVGTCKNVAIGVFNFDYTGEYQKFTAPVTGEYNVELWGASGYGDKGKGAYTSGTIALDQGDNLYIYVGGSDSASKRGYNGGGTGRNADALGDKYGGGATDVRYFESTPDSTTLEATNFEGLKARIMVAAGGGGSATDSRFTYGNAGGLTGYTFVDSSYPAYTSNGGGQIVGGGVSNYSCTTSVATPGTFGKGGNAGGANPGGSCGGGGGYYGGAGGPRLCSGTWGGGGGSSFISGFAGCNAIDESSTSTAIVHTGSSEHYSGKTFTNGVMIDGKGCSWATGSATNCQNNHVQPDGSTSDGHVGNGYARISINVEFEEEDEDEPDEPQNNHLTIYYDNGVSNITFYTECDLCSDPASFQADKIVLGTGYYGNFYTDPIDLSSYNSLIVKSSAGTSDRMYFCQTPQYANSLGDAFNFPTAGVTSLGDDYYVINLSAYTRSDLHLTMNHYYSSGSTNIYYIAFSTRTVEEIVADHSFLP